MGKQITIDPVTRVEGHGRITIHLDDYGQVKDTFFHVVEFRGFERFIQGRPYWEAPVLVQRLCGICPVSHHLAAAKAIDQLVGLNPEEISATANKIRRLLHYAQVFQSHALHFFYLASPDLLFGADAPKEKRNVMTVAIENKELATRGILMRRFGQEIIKRIAGKKIHGISAIPGGVYKNLTKEERAIFIDGKGIESVSTMKAWVLDVLRFIQQYHETHKKYLDEFAYVPSGSLGMVGMDNEMELYHGSLRAIDSIGNVTLDNIGTDAYASYFSEAIEQWSYMKFPYLKHVGRAEGWNRVGPLARLNVSHYIPTPLAEAERKLFFEFAGSNVVHSTMYSHWARLIEMLHCAELIEDLLHDDDLSGTELVRKGVKRNEGIGIIEAPRGTLIHHYAVDDKGMITKCNLIVSTTHNNEAMNRAVRWVANNVINQSSTISEGMLNQVEMAIRAFDPCLSCATQALGKMPLQVELYDSNHLLIKKIRNE